VAWKDPVAAPAVEICQMASKVGAKAAGVNAGDIVVGKEADCLLIDLNVPCMVPCYDMVSNIVYSASNECVDTVICGGEILMRGRKVNGEEEIIAKARESVKRLTNS
jgi:5-methylthioadenosine/S-adenosylhomocysteine deaminase